MSSEGIRLSAGSRLAPHSTADRVSKFFKIRTQTAEDDALVPAPPQVDNGDEARYSDKCGTYSKGLPQMDIARVDLTAYKAFKKALNSGNPDDFEAIPLGGTSTLNGPQGGLAYDLQCLDASQFAVPPAPALASEEYAAELVELYWASLLRDVPFEEYGANAMAIQAAQELSSLRSYQGPRDSSGKVTPRNLFRGGRSDGSFAGQIAGPYVSQFLLQKTSMGALAIDQRYTAFASGLDYLTDPRTFLQAQNGIPTGNSLAPQAPRYVHNGRGLVAYTHSDVLYQAYFTALLVLTSLNAPLNPGNPYLNQKVKTQNGFTTMGGPDFAATVAAVASEALKAVWFQKWYVHLRHRPEVGGGIVHLVKTKHGNRVEGRPADAVLNSRAVESSFARYGSYFLSQAFPEGSPTHPAYPTGHGTVAGACITVLKFFFDGGWTFPNVVEASNDGTALSAYTGPHAGDLTVNGELHKIAHNISFGHGIHAGIHWRSDSDTSIELGEEVALSVLRDRAVTYNEKFTIEITKVDGSTATISNQ